MFNGRIAMTLCAFLVTMFMATTASADAPSSSIVRKFKNNSNSDRTDLHIYFNGPVDAATGVTGYNPPFPNITNAGSNVIELSGGTVPDGHSTGCMTFTSTADGLAIVIAKWTPGPVDIPSGDITTCSTQAPPINVPMLSEYSLLLLAILIVVSAGWIMWRRRRLTVAA